MNWKQFLTEKVLGECWHDGTSILMAGYHCKKCDKIFTCNRTYSTEADTMELYRQIEKDGKWDVFFWNSASSCKPKRHGLGASETTAWLFCLSGEGYEERCKMVAEFYGWEVDIEEAIDKIIRKVGNLPIFRNVQNSPVDNPVCCAVKIIRGGRADSKRQKGYAKTSR